MRAETGSQRQEGIGSARRYYLLKAQEAERIGDIGLAAAWRGKHDAAPGTLLDASFPSFEKLVRHRYSAVEDLTGATPDELVLHADLTFSEARAVFDALAKLLQQQP